MENFLLPSVGTPKAWLLALLAAAGTAPAGATTPAGWHRPTAVALLGFVFEDVNYGGGAGRPRNTTGTSSRPSATVELYSAAGTLLQTTTTDASGLYSFTVEASTTYQVRVVNSTVTSSRAGYTAALLPVQTYAGQGNDPNAGNRVGGANPAKTDAPGNPGNQTLADLTPAGGTTTPESVVSVTTGTDETVGPSFGYCFDVVVNTNGAGQGSLRQFVLNASALGGEGSLAQSGSTRSTTSSASTALPGGRETSIFMIPDGQAHPGLLAAGAGGPTSQLTTQNGQQVAVITLTVADGSLGITGTNPTLTSLDGGTQTANVGNTNAAVLGTGGSVGTTASLSYGSFSGPEVELLGEYAAGNAASSRKPRNGINVQADDFWLRNVAMRNFGNPGGQGAVGFDNVPGRTGPLSGYTGTNGATAGPQGPVRALIENNVLGSDAASFAAPSPFASNEGDNGRNNQHLQYDVSGTSPTVRTLTVRTNLIGFSERRALHVQGNSAITSGYNINLSAYDNVFQEAGVSGNPFSNSSPYAASAAGAIELIQTTTPYVEIYNNRISGPGTVSSYNGLGSDGIELNNARVSTPSGDPTQTANNERRDAGAAQQGSRIEQNSISNQRLAVLCQSNAAFAAYALDNLPFTGNSFTNNYLGLYNQGAGHTYQNNVVSGSMTSGLITIGPTNTLTGNTLSSNGASGLIVGDASQSPATATKPATTGVVVGPGNTVTSNGATGTLLTNASTRATVSQNAHYANGGLAIDLSANGTGNGVTPNNGTLNESFPNRELDYPILTSALLTGNQLMVSGYVGSAAGQSTFANATVELFRADNSPANQNGPVVAGDGQSVPHGKGRAYLGALTADASGNFSGTLTVSSLSSGDQVTATATLGTSGTATAATSEFGNNATVTAPLPVQLVAFTARAGTDRDAYLSWTTASELNSAAFVVERSLDGVSFAEIGRRAGQGTKTGSTIYAHTDAGIGQRVAGAVYYRLRQVDTDGSTSYSPVRTVRFGAAADLSLAPNPAGPATTLDLSALPTDATYQLLLLDAVGRPVRRLTASGGQVLPLDLRELASGTYLLVLTGSQTDGTPLRQALRLMHE